MNQKYNILQCLPFVPPHVGGVENVVDQFSRAYTLNQKGQITILTYEIGIDISLYTKNHLGNNIFNYEKEGMVYFFIPGIEVIPNFPIPKIWKKEFWKILFFLKKYTKENIDIIQTHTRFFTTTLLGAYIAKYAKTPWIHIEHGSDFVKTSSRFTDMCAYIYDIVFGRIVFSQASQIIAISEACKKFIHFFSKRDIKVIYNYIHFHTQKKNPHLGIHIAYVGRIVELKGCEYFLEVMRDTKKIFGEKIHITLVGDGDARQYLQNNFGDIAHFLGFQNKKFLENEFYPQIDILVNPSFQEGLPTTVIEGLLSKTVVVASDVGGTSEISNGEDLLLFHAGNKEDLKKKLLYAIEKYQSLSGISYVKVQHKFSQPAVFAQYDDLYSQLKPGK